MSCTILTAPAAGGKTSDAVQLAMKTAAGLEAEVRVCVPTYLQAKNWRNRLADAGGAIGIHILSYDKLVAACLNAAQLSYTEISRLVQYQLLRSLIPALNLEHYAAIQDKPGFIQAALDVIEDLKGARIDSEVFLGAAEDMGAGPRLVELGRLYGAYQASLRDNGWADRYGLSWLAVDALGNDALPACRDWPLLIVDGFDDFDAVQLALFHQLARRVGDFRLYLPAGEQAVYPRYTRTLARAADALGIEPRALDGAQADGREPGLRRLSRAIFSKHAPEPALGERAVSLSEASNPADEVRLALGWLKEQIVHRDCRPDETALLARDLTAFRPFVRQVAAEYGLPVQLFDGQPLSSSPVIDALLELLKLWLPGPRGDEQPALRRRDVVNVWRSPYFSWEALETPITPADADRLDQLARRYRVITGLDQWEEAFESAGTAEASKAEGRDDEDESRALGLGVETVERLDGQWKGFLKLIRPSDSGTMRGYVRWLENLIGPDTSAGGDTRWPHRDASDTLTRSLRVIDCARGHGSSLPTEPGDIAALRQLKELLRGLVWAEDAVERGTPLDYSSFVRELSAAIRGTHYSEPEDGIARILVTTVVNARGASFKAAAIMGMNEGVFPRSLKEDTFLRDSDRAYLRRLGAILDPSTDSAEREFFYDAVSRPREKLLLTRSRLEENGAEWEPSVFWDATVRLFSDVEVRSGAERPAASWPEWWEELARLGVSEPVPTGHADWKRIEAGAAAFRARTKSGPASGEGDLSAVAGELAEKYGPQHVWSASRLETYNSCAFQFFIGSVLGLEPREEPAEGLDARQLGSVYHAIFQAVCLNGLSDVSDEVEARAIVRRVAKQILEDAPSQWGFQPTLWWTKTQEDIISTVARSLVAQELSGKDYRFFRAEVPFGFSHRPDSLPTLELSDGNGGNLRFRGFIDRIDERESDGTLRIIDYKLGDKSNFGVKHITDGKKLQLPLYVLAAEQGLGRTVSDAFYWHFRKPEPSDFQLSNAPDAPALTASRIREAIALVRNGAFAPQPPEGSCPDYCTAAAFCWHYTPRPW